MREWTLLLAAIGQLTLAAMAFRARGKNAVARPLALLCLALFGWNFSVFGRLALRVDAFAACDASFTAISPPLVLEFVARFVGQTRRWRLVRRGIWLVSGSLALASLGGLVSREILIWDDSASWIACFLAGWMPSLGFEIWLLVRHLGSTSDLREKARTRIVLSALTVGAAFALCDVGRSLGLPLPYLGAIGTLVSAGFLALCALRFELFDQNMSARTAVYILAMIGAFVTLYLVGVRAFAGNVAAQAFATTIVLVLVVLTARELSAAAAEGRERLQRLAVLGRFSAQMAHDIKSPLSALLGAVQVLERTRSDAERAEFLDLVAAQAHRVAAIVNRYDRMGRIEPLLSLVRVNEIARGVARARGIEDAAIELDASDPECDLDRDLFESAVENVVRNALEAGGAVRIVTQVDAGAALVRVVDTGEGMDARQLGRAFDDFFTTKAEGSGLGLAFVRRVMLAHGGDVTMQSERGVGTTVELRLPPRPAPTRH